jgi:hypothetical protein
VCKREREREGEREREKERGRKRERERETNIFSLCKGKNVTVMHTVTDKNKQ